MKELTTYLLVIFGFVLLSCVVGLVVSLLANEPEHIRTFGYLGAIMLVGVTYIYGYRRGYGQALHNHSIVEPPDDFTISI